MDITLNLAPEINAKIYKIINTDVYTASYLFYSAVLYIGPFN